MKLKPVILNDEIIPYYILRENRREIFKKHSTIVNMDIAIIYYAWYGRNAWNYTWATKYEKYGFFTQIDKGKSWIETQRVQGSVWQITQLPTLCISLANNIQLWLCSINEKNWWNSYIFDWATFISKISSNRTNTLQIKECVRSHDKLLSFTSSMTDKVESLNSHKSCKEWSARSFGGGYRLSWILESPIRYNYKLLYDAVNLFYKNRKKNKK